MPTPVLLELAPGARDASAQQLFEGTCAALTECVLVPLRAALPETGNCSLLVDRATFVTELTLDGVRTLRVSLHGVTVDAEVLWSETVRACCSRSLSAVVERVALDTDESANHALDAMAALLCAVLVACAVQWYRRTAAAS